MRLLIVEDNAELGQLLTKKFQNSGYDADVVSMFEEARIVLMTRHYAALVLDLGLPDGDALSLVKSLRNGQERRPNPHSYSTGRDRRSRERLARRR